MTTDKNKLKTLNKLTDEGFDTEKKITSIDMKVAYDHGLSGEIGVILELQEGHRLPLQRNGRCEAETRKDKQQ